MERYAIHPTADGKSVTVTDTRTGRTEIVALPKGATAATLQVPAHTPVASQMFTALPA